MTTFADLLRARAESEATAFLHEDSSWTYADLVREASRRASLLGELRDHERPPHVGVLLDNVPDYLFWLAAAAVSGAVVVGINSTYRGDQLGQLVRHTDCQLLVTSSDHVGLLEGVAHGVDAERILVVDEPAYAERLSAAPVTAPDVVVDEDDLLLLIFTSGSTGLPKAVRCTQGRLARTGAHVRTIAELGPDDVVYAPLPFFHASALFTGWSSAVNAEIPIATRRRFSASGTLPDIRRYGVTMLTYTGKVLNYVLATPEQPDDADSPLRLCVGNEASIRDIREFARRFGCTVRDSYGATEGIFVIRRSPEMPEGALGSAEPSVKVLDPETGEECPPGVVGEIVETEPTSGFEGYYRNEAATQERFRDGRYWSGDLAWRDEDGWLFFAGRSNDWLRVDSENFAAAPVEAIIARHPDVRAVSVYAVPDDGVGDRVMAAVELWPGATFDPVAFDAFLDDQPDLGTKWRPSFVRVTDELPKLASMKLDKQRLRDDAWRAGTVHWRPAKGEPLRLLGDDDRAKLEPLLDRRP